MFMQPLRELACGGLQNNTSHSDSAKNTAVPSSELGQPFIHHTHRNQLARVLLRQGKAPPNREKRLCEQDV